MSVGKKIYVTTTYSASESAKKRFQVNFAFKVIAKNYQGEIFEGNACRKLIENSDRLLDPELGNDPFLVMPYVVVLRNYNKVVHDCFSTAKISPDTKKDIEAFKQSIVDAGLSETLKLHIIMHHLEEGLDALNEEKDDLRCF